ncbi:hypothetical protein GF386_00565 [Candidatus Pacearchaeota archaeon]|nr:hypothetical protein [Candidatus Pacearchaeota archaeon]
MKKRYKWLLIQGCPRSGTTALTNMLNSHKNMALSYELDLSKTNKGDIAKMYKSFFIGHKNINSIIFFGDKLPGYCFENISKLKKRLGIVKIIHISRNPTFTISSMISRSKNAKLDLDNSWNPDLNIYDSCNHWIYSWNHINKIKKHSDVLHLKYEDLIENPEIEGKKIAEFLDISDQFDTSIIKNKKQQINLEPSETKILNNHLKEIIKKWHLPLEYLMNRFQKIKPIGFFKIRKLILDHKLNFSKIKAKKQKNENCNFS